MINIPLLYHGTDLRFVNFSEDLRKNFHDYCYYLREILYSKFSQYYDFNDNNHSTFKDFMGICLDNNPKLMKNFQEAMSDVLLSKKSEEYEYGSFYVTSDLFSAFFYAKKAYAGGEFAFAAYALAKAAKERGLQDWYHNDKIPNIDVFVDNLIKVAEDTPQPVIFKINNINPLFLKTEANESIDRYIRNGKLTAVDFRYTGPIVLTDYEYIVVDDDFLNKTFKNS